MYLQVAGEENEPERGRDTRRQREREWRDVSSVYVYE